MVQSIQQQYLSRPGGLKSLEKKKKKVSLWRNPPYFSAATVSASRGLSSKGSTDTID